MGKHRSNSQYFKRKKNYKAKFLISLILKIKLTKIILKKKRKSVVGKKKKSNTL
jgi:hypothetical protein